MHESEASLCSAGIISAACSHCADLCTVLLIVLIKCHFLANRQGVAAVIPCALTGGSFSPWPQLAHGDYIAGQLGPTS